MLGQVDYTSNIGLGSILVTVAVAIGVAYIRLKLEARSHAERVWQGEHTAQKERGDRLQREKDEQQAKLDELGTEVVRLKVRCAELEGRPDLGMLKEMLETGALAQTAMAQTLMEQLALHDRHAMEGLGELAGDIRKLVSALQDRASKYRRDDDQVGDPPA